MKSILLLAFLFLICEGLPTEKLLDEWKLFKAKYYSRKRILVNEKTRFEIFKENYEKMEEHNIKYEQKKVSYKMGINKFSDKTDEEIMKKPVMEIKNVTSHSATKYYNFPNKTMEGNFDWRKLGYVTRVKDQQECSSCWSFGTTGTLEGQYFAKTGHLIPLSEQMLMDCILGSVGCDKGYSVDKAYQWITKNGGINYESVYPYENQNNHCRAKHWALIAPVKTYLEVMFDEKTIQKFLMNLGPVAVAIYTNPHFHKYESGIFDDIYCHGQIDHSVLLVGYGYDSILHKEYYIVKNSWGEDWGEKGYFRMVRDVNMCEVGFDGVIPVL